MRHLGNRGTEQYKYKIRGDPADAGTASNQSNSPIGTQDVKLLDQSNH